MVHNLFIFLAQGYKRPPLGKVSIMATFQCPEATRVTLPRALPMFPFRGPARLWITGNLTPFLRAEPHLGSSIQLLGAFSHLGANSLQTGLSAQRSAIPEFYSCLCSSLVSCAPLLPSSWLQSRKCHVPAVFPCWTGPRDSGILHSGGSRSSGSCMCGP